MDEQAEPVLTWNTLPAETRQLLAGKLTGLWGATTDDAAFDSWPLDKKQALLLLFDRLYAKGLWNLVKRVTNVYGEGGVGIGFEEAVERLADDLELSFHRGAKEVVRPVVLPRPTRREADDPAGGAL